MERQIAVVGIREGFFKELIFISGVTGKDFRQSQDLGELRHRENLGHSRRQRQRAQPRAC